MRVLYVHSGNLYGGVETLMVTLARNRSLCPSMEPHFALCFDGRLRDELMASEVPVHSLGAARVSRPLTVLRARRALSALLERERFDVAICHSSWTHAIFGPVIRENDLRLVFWLHGAASGTHWLERWARRSKPDFVICNSRYTESTLSNLFHGVPSEVLYCPVELVVINHTEMDRREVRVELQTPGDAIVIIQASRLEPWKGHKLHLEALGTLRELPDWVCWVVGGSQRPKEVEYLADLKALANRLRIADRVRFLDERKDVARLMAAADIYCQPNTGAEPFGIAFVEALAAGLPVVTTAIGGAKEIVNDSCGMLVPREDSTALSGSLRQLIQAQPLRFQLGIAGPARAQHLCDTATQMRRLAELLSMRDVQAEVAA